MKLFLAAALFLLMEGGLYLYLDGPKRGGCGSALQRRSPRSCLCCSAFTARRTAAAKPGCCLRRCASASCQTCDRPAFCGGRILLPHGACHAHCPSAFAGAAHAMEPSPLGAALPASARILLENAPHTGGKARAALYLPGFPVRHAVAGCRAALPAAGVSSACLALGALCFTVSDLILADGVVTQRESSRRDHAVMHLYEPAVYLLALSAVL